MDIRGIIMVTHHALCYNSISQLEYSGSFLIQHVDYEKKQSKMVVVESLETN